MDLKSYLENLSLGVYAPIFSERGYDSISQLTHLTNAQLDQLFQSLSLLKGHAIKLRKSIEMSRAAEPPPVKKAKVIETSPMKPEVRSFKPAATLPQPGTIMMKEAERLAAKLTDIANIREDYQRAKDLVLSIDIEKYRRMLDEVVSVQDALAKTWRPDLPIEGEYETALEQ
jgi:hypothetical protein